MSHATPPDATPASEPSNASLAPTRTSVPDRERPERPKLEKKTAASSQKSSHQISVAGLAEQVRQWIISERQKQLKRMKRRSKKKKTKSDKGTQVGDEELVDGTDHKHDRVSSPDAASNISDTASTSSSTPHDEITHASLDQLELILAAAHASSTTSLSRKISHKRSLGKIRSEKTLDAESDPAAVPSCDVVLEIPEKIGLAAFKQEILKLAHTLRCKGWRKIPLDEWEGIEVSRISGALTNAVYMVTPPEKVVERLSAAKREGSYISSRRGSIDGPPTVAGTPTVGGTPTPSAPIVKLLLRIYGAQVDNLIDRDSELAVLRRLARRKIGPSLLGTFTNGRFEQFFDADTLTKNDLRDPVTSTYIAKRMRELHDGVEVEEFEKAAGPSTWVVIKKWDAIAAKIDARHEKPLLGYRWADFSAQIWKYKEWIGERFPDSEELAFCHNDTQYGNILRKRTPVPEATPHKCLVVIDFEYSSANTRAYDIANHFCEWMADYHTENDPHRMHQDQFPTDSEMRRFCKAYISHGAVLSGLEPPDIEAEVDKILVEAKAWRAASNALWCAWGVVQAKDGDLEEGDFDYIGYAKERAGLFWGDMEDFGLVTKEENEKAGRYVKRVR